MKKVALLLAVSVCVLTPSTARANDGGFWDMLFRWDPKVFGYGTEFHLACLDASGSRIEGCEEWFKNLKHSFNPRAADVISHPFDFDKIKHEIDFRVSFMHTYGDVVSDLRPGEENRTIFAMKLMGVYHYHKNRQFEIGAAGGAIPIFGGGIDAFWRGILTPVSVIYSPGKTRFYVRFEESFITGRITGADLGHRFSSFAKDGEWNFSATVGFDLRRIGS